MTQYDYALFRKSLHSAYDLDRLRFDVLISGYNSSPRVNELWARVSATHRIWIDHVEYGFSKGEIPDADALHDGLDGEGEIDFWLRLIRGINLTRAPKDSSIAVDITGIMRQHVMAMPLAFALAGFDKITALYSDPDTYAGGIKTRFSIGSVLNVAPVNGFEGVHGTSLDEQDLLIIGGGYDNRLISAVAESKRAAEHAVLVGLPSLQPHMYQESLLKLHEASEFINNYSRRTHLFAPANDRGLSRRRRSSRSLSRGKPPMGRRMYI